MFVLRECLHTYSWWAMYDVVQRIQPCTTVADIGSELLPYECHIMGCRMCTYIDQYYIDICTATIRGGHADESEVTLREAKKVECDDRYSYWKMHRRYNGHVSKVALKAQPRRFARYIKHLEGCFQCQVKYLIEQFFYVCRGSKARLGN